MTEELPSRSLAAAPTGFSYVDAQVIDRIGKKSDAARQLDYSKLLRLIEELNDNYTKHNAYAAHALLRAILDHIPPILGCDEFKSVANNYPWSQTDKSYMRKLLDFKSQAHDALHRKISRKPDLLSIDDMPPRVWVNRLLQECDGSNTMPSGADAQSVSSRGFPGRAVNDAKVSGAGRVQAGRPSIFQHQRMSGDITLGDIRSWVSVLILGGIAAIAAFFAFRTWPLQFSGRPDPHRYICYAVVAVGVIISALSILEGLASVKVPEAGLPLHTLTRAVKRPVLRRLRWAREVTSLAASLLVFSGLFGFQNYGALWSIALAAVGGLALIALVRIAVHHGGDCFLAGAILLLTGTFVPITLDDGAQTTFGVQTLQGFLAALLAVLLGVGWLYLWAPSLLVLLTLLAGAMMFLLVAYDPHVVIGPYVVFVACVIILVAIAQGNSRSLDAPQ